MNAKVFEVILHKLPSGKSPVSALEDQLNHFLHERPELRLVATHMSSLVAPAEPNAMPRTEEGSIIIFLHPVLHRIGGARDMPSNIHLSPETCELYGHGNA